MIINQNKVCLLKVIIKMSIRLANRECYSAWFVGKMFWHKVTLDQIEND